MILVPNFNELFVNVTFYDAINRQNNNTVRTMITKMQTQANVAVPQSVTTQPQQIVGVPANAVILKMSDIQQISTVGE